MEAGAGGHTNLISAGENLGLLPRSTGQPEKGLDGGDMTRFPV